MQSWFLDINVLVDDFASEEEYCHTVPISPIFALEQTLQLIEDEGMENRTARHEAAAGRLLEEQASQRDRSGHSIDENPGFAPCSGGID